jgi:hypothetical protein
MAFSTPGLPEIADMMKVRGIFAKDDKRGQPLAVSS